MPSLFEREEWLKAVANLKAKAAEFNQLYSQVDQSAVIVRNHQTLSLERDKLLNRGNIIRSTIEALTKSIDYIFSMFNQVFGSDDTDNMSNLGVIPLVPIAVIASAIAAITYWINDTTKYINRVNEIKRLETQGYSPEQAYNIVEKKKQGILSAILDPTFLIVGAGVIGVLLLTNRNRGY